MAIQDIANVRSRAVYKLESAGCSHPMSGCGPDHRVPGSGRSCENPAVDALQGSRRPIGGSAWSHRRHRTSRPLTGRTAAHEAARPGCPMEGATAALWPWHHAPSVPSDRFAAPGGGRSLPPGPGRGDRFRWPAAHVAPSVLEPRLLAHRHRAQGQECVGIRILRKTAGPRHRGQASHPAHPRARGRPEDLRTQSGTQCRRAAPGPCVTPRALRGAPR